MHAVTSLLGFFNDLYKPMKTCTYVRKKKPFRSYPAAKHPNTTNLRLQTYNKNLWTFLITTHGVDFSGASTLALAIIFKIQVPSQKFPFLGLTPTNFGVVFHDCFISLFSTQNSLLIVNVFILAQFESDKYCSLQI